MTKYELIPTNSRKSFYGKAMVEIPENGNQVLYSYNTKIITKTHDNKLIRHWDGWSATTGNHIRSFCGLNKVEFFKLKLS